MSSNIHYEQASYQLFGSIHRNEDYQSTLAVRVYTAEDTDLLPVDELRLIHQTLLEAAAEVLDQMALVASEAQAIKP